MTKLENGVLRSTLARAIPSRLTCGGLRASLALAFATSLLAAPAFPPAADFIEKHCASCHNDIDKESGLDLTSLAFKPADRANFDLWIRIHDRVQAGEMPPEKKPRPSATDSTAFLSSLAGTFTAHERDVATREGRATRRRSRVDEVHLQLAFDLGGGACPG